MNSTRTYTMTARARSVEQTRTRILDATFALHSERLAGDIALDDVAERAGVSVQTVLRHFGNRDGLVRATVEHARTRVVEERQAPVGDVRAAVRVIVDHYERRGEGVLVLLAQEGTEGFVREITDRGRQLHREWVAAVFAPYLPGAGDSAADPDGGALLDLLVVATDVYTWKLLRRDRGLTRADTEARMLRLVEALL
ncbi:TetR/AcrR family transcriptional regulator [Nocardioides taihuensis]|uniref:TetR/AcrR family transcriptional regulator n=1 Tax=Nocardioides taihuensis TaxID=1835606 RepID=A0ABW0BNV7_9ACTN